MPPPAVTTLFRGAGARGAKCEETSFVSVCIKPADAPGADDIIYAQGR